MFALQLPTLTDQVQTEWDSAVDPYSLSFDITVWSFFLKVTYSAFKFNIYVFPWNKLKTLALHAPIAGKLQI